jgi:hypothetical protein
MCKYWRDLTELLSTGNAHGWQYNDDPGGKTKLVIPADGTRRHASLSPDQYELNKETFMTASARVPGRSEAKCRVATEAPKQAKDAAPNSSADPAPVERRSSKQRSRMTNGTALLPDIDGRSAIARRFKDITSAILADQGGADQCAESRLQLVRRFAAAAVLAEQLESRLANGEQIDIQEHALLCSTLARLASRIGLERRARDVTTLADYLQRHQETAE